MLYLFLKIIHAGINAIYQGNRRMEPVYQGNHTIVAMSHGNHMSNVSRATARDCPYPDTTI